MDNSSENKNIDNKSLPELRGILKKERVDYWCIPISLMKRGQLIQQIQIMRKMKTLKEETSLDETLLTNLPPRDIPIVPVVENDLEMEIPTAPKLRKKKASKKEITQNEKIKALKETN